VHVKTGAELEDRIEITSGLKEGDIVVISGAYLLHSEYVFRKGTEPSAAHQH
jgi:Cu(I)/Ag(I) efflux system membrane fusion protein